MSGSSEMLVSWWSWHQIVCVGWAFPKLSPRLLGWTDLLSEASLLLVRPSPKQGEILQVTVTFSHRSWQSCGFE